MFPKIDVRSQTAKNIDSGTLSFEYEAEDLLDIPYVEFSAPVKAEFVYEISEDDTVEVKGRITFTLKGACSRCLAEAEQTFTAEAEGVFEPGEGDGETYGYVNGRISLEEFLRDALAFALPPRLLCGACVPEGEKE